MSNQKITKFLLIIVLITSIYMNFSLSNQLTNIEYKLNDLSQNFYQLGHSLDNQVANLTYELEKEMVWCYEKQVEVISASEDLEQATVLLKASLNELKNSEKLSFIVVDNADNVVKKVSAANNGALQFSQEVTLPTQDDYLVYIQAETAETVRNALVGDIELNKMYHEPFYAWVMLENDKEDIAQGLLKGDFGLEAYGKSMPQLEKMLIEDVTMIILYQGSPLGEANITNWHEYSKTADSAPEPGWKDQMWVFEFQSTERSFTESDLEQISVVFEIKTDTGKTFTINLAKIEY